MSMLATINSLPHILISEAEEKRLMAIATAASQRVPEVSAAFSANWNVLTFGPRRQCPLMWFALARSSNSRSMTAGV